jgi:hypothetical protein
MILQPLKFLESFTIRALSIFESTLHQTARERIFTAEIAEPAE